MTIIDFRKKVANDQSDLTSLLKLAVDLRNKLPRESEKKTFNSLKNLISGKICEILLEKKMIEFGYIACGLYIADTLDRLTTKEPDSWYAIDYFLKAYEDKNPEILKQGANVCFLICAIFKARGNRRVMTVGHYQKMGVGLYMQFFRQTGQEIGYHMGKNFPIMAEVTEKCLKTL